MNDDFEITCPHRDCDDVLCLQWYAARSLVPSDLANDAASMTMDMAHSETWSVECAAGHVVLLPGPPGCPCDDPEGSDCTHDPDDFDWSDDNRTFRTHDYERLRKVRAALGWNSGWPQ